MYKLILASVFSFTLLSCTESRIAKDNEKKKIDNVCDKIMQLFQERKLVSALQLLKQHSVLQSSSIDTLQVTILSQIKSVFPSYGRMLSYEFISEYKIKDFIAKRFYILKFEKYYLKFDFTLYNNGEGWKITGFKYNDELIELLY